MVLPEVVHGTVAAAQNRPAGGHVNTIAGRESDRRSRGKMCLQMAREIGREQNVIGIEKRYKLAGRMLQRP